MGSTDGIFILLRLYKYLIGLERALHDSDRYTLRTVPEWYLHRHSL